MTPEYFEVLQENQRSIQYQLDVLYSVMLAIVALLFAVLFSKVVLHERVYEITLRVIRAVSEIRAAKSQAELTEHKLDDNAAKIQQKVDEVPQKVVQQIAEAASDSAADGDLKRPTLPSTTKK